MPIKVPDSNANKVSTPMNLNLNSQSLPLHAKVDQKSAPVKIDSTLEKIGQSISSTVKENTKEGTFVGDNMLITGAGTLVGGVAAASAINKTVNAIPAVKDALQTVFVKNGQAVGGGAALAASALLAEDAIASFKEGSPIRATAEGTGAALLGLGGAELIGRNYDIPVMNRALTGPAQAAGRFIENKVAPFVQNHGLGVLGAGAIGGAAYLGKSGVEDLQDGDYLKAAGKLSGAGLATLGGAEIIGHNYNLNALKGVLSTPVKKVAEFAVNHAGGIGGTAITGAGVALAASGVQDLKTGDSMLGAGKLAGGAIAGLGGVEMIGRNYNVPVMDKALTGSAAWLKNNVQAVTGGAAVAGGVYALQDGIQRLNADDGNKWIAGAEIAGGVAGTLGGIEMIGRNYNIPGMNQALTGPVKFIFTSKAGITGAGGLISASGIGLAADGVRRLTTEKGIVNDAIGAAEFTAGVAAATGGLSVIGYATGSEKLMQVFPKNADILGASALIASGAAMGKFTVDDMQENGLTLTNTATATGAGLLATGGAHVIASKFAGNAVDAGFNKAYTGVAVAGLGAASFKLGEKAIEEGKEFFKDTSDLKTGAKALGYGAGAVASGATAIQMVENNFKIPIWKHADAAAGTGLIGGGALLGKYTVDSIKDKGLTLTTTATATGAGLLATAGTQILANKFGFETANPALIKGYQSIGAAGLGVAAFKLGEMAVEEGSKFAENSDDQMAGAKALGLGTAAVASGTAAVGLAGHAYNVPVLENVALKIFEKGGQATAAIGLGAATFKLGDMAIDQGKKFVNGPSWSSGGAAVGLATAGVLTAAGSTVMAGKVLGMPGIEKAGLTVFTKMGAGIEGTAHFAAKSAENVFNAAVKYPFVTLGALAVAGAGGYYLYSHNKDQETESKPASEVGKTPIIEAAAPKSAAVEE